MVGVADVLGTAAGAVRTAAAVVGIPPLVLVLLVVSVLVVVWFVAGLFFSGAIWTWLAVGAVGFAIYYGWVTGAFDALIADMRTYPQKYLPLVLGLAAFGIAFPYVVGEMVYADMVVTLKYRVVAPAEGGWMGQIFGAAIDRNSIEANLSVVSSFYGVPVLHRPQFDPEVADRVGVGYYLVVEIPDLRRRYIFPIRNVSWFSRLEGGVVERFFLYSVPLPDEPKFVINLYVYENGVPIWSERVLAQVH